MCTTVQIMYACVNSLKLLFVNVIVYIGMNIPSKEVNKVFLDILLYIFIDFLNVARHKVNIC